MWWGLASHGFSRTPCHYIQWGREINHVQDSTLPATLSSELWVLSELRMERRLVSLWSSVLAGPSPHRAECDLGCNYKHCLYVWGWKGKLISAEQTAIGVNSTTCDFCLRYGFQSPTLELDAAPSIGHVSLVGILNNLRQRKAVFVFSLVEVCFAYKSLSGARKIVINTKALYKWFPSFSSRRWPKHWGGLCGRKAGGALFKLSLRPWASLRSPGRCGSVPPLPRQG